MLTFSEHLACTHCGLSFEELAPRNFSFNSPYGACERCDGLGHALRGRPGAGRLRRRPQHRRGRDRAVGRVPEPVLRPGARRGRRRVRLLGRHAVAEAPQDATSKAVLYGIGQARGQRPLQEPVRAAALVHDRVRGRGAVARAPPLGGRERPRARADRGLHARGAVPGVSRRAAAAGVAGGHRRRAEHLRGRASCRSPRRRSSSAGSSCPSAT